MHGLNIKTDMYMLGESNNSASYSTVYFNFRLPMTLYKSEICLTYTLGMKETLIGHQTLQSCRHWNINFFDKNRLESSFCHVSQNHVVNHFVCEVGPFCVYCHNL